MGGENSKFSAKRAREIADTHTSKWTSANELDWGYGRDRGKKINNRRGRGY